MSWELELSWPTTWILGQMAPQSLSRECVSPLLGEVLGGHSFLSQSWFLFMLGVRWVFGGITILSPIPSPGPRGCCQCLFPFQRK